MAITKEEFFRGGQAPDNKMTVNAFLGGGGFSMSEPSPDKKLNFLQRVGRDWRDRLEMGKGIIEATEAGEQTFAEGVLQIAGKVGAGGALDLIGEGVVSAFRGISKITPDIIEKPVVETAKAAGLLFLGTKVGQEGLDAIQGGIEVYNKWKQKNQRAARNLESVVDIGLLVAPVKGKPKPAKSIFGKLGERALVSGEKAKAVGRGGFIDDLIRPKQTVAVREAQVVRTTEVGETALTRKKVVQPSVAEKAIASEVSKISGVSRAKTLQGNFNMIVKENRKIAEQLSSQLKKEKVSFSKQQQQKLVSFLSFFPEDP